MHIAGQRTLGLCTTHAVPASAASFPPAKDSPVLCNSLAMMEGYTRRRDGTTIISRPFRAGFVAVFAGRGWKDCGGRIFTTKCPAFVPILPRSGLRRASARRPAVARRYGGQARKGRKTNERRALLRADALHVADDRSQPQRLHAALVELEALNFVHRFGGHVAFAAVRADDHRDLVNDDHACALPIGSRNMLDFRFALSADFAGHGYNPHSV